MLDLPRTAIGGVVLAYAVWSDLRSRRVPDRTWLVPLAAGLLMDVPDAMEGGLPFLRDAALSAGIMVPLALAIYYAPGSGFGGADAKALMALSVLLPQWPAMGPFPLRQSLTPPLANFTAPSGIFMMGVFHNALLVSLLIPPSLVVWNLARKKRSRYMWVGYRVKVSALDPVRMRLLEDHPGFRGKRITKEVLDDLRARKRPDDEVWVTPLFPFMVSLAFGYGTALAFGNLLLELITLGRLPP